MKYYNERTEQQLGFDRLREFLIGRANTEDGKALCERLKPYAKPGGIDIELTRVLECKELLETDESFTLEIRDSMEIIFDHASVNGHWLILSDLFRFLKWLQMVRDVISYFRTRKEKYPTLWSGIERLDWRKDLLVRLKGIVDAKGNMKDDASPTLKVLRRQRMSLSSDLRRQLNSILRHASQSGWTDASEITIRNDRYVIPLNADFKGRIKGFVHDVSQSGRTVFVEPSSVLDANNRIREVLLQEKNEITRILIEATTWIREELPALKDYAKSVARLDFIRAKARLAVDTKSIKPKFDRKGNVAQILQGRHPLLMLKEGMTYEQVIPLTVRMEKEKSRIILISGPNAGGKSVSLKTIGLLQLMIQSGLLVPCDEESEFVWFEKLFIDIGDEQSIQSDLSTYTSHLANMQVMIQSMDDRSLFLVDEFGSGTDPRLGGAMAEAFLERFLASGAFGVITTHYGNLKNFADNRPGIVNAAMQFNPQSLSPTYQIEIGVPGRSYAFEIARNVGIPEEILDEARSKVDGDQLQSEELLLKLEGQKAELEAVLKEQKENNSELKHWLTRNQEMNRMIKQQETRILREAHEAAQALINEANSKIERTIKEIRENQADREKTKELRTELREMLPDPPPALPDEVVQEEEKEAAPEIIKGEEINIGDWVQVRESQSTGKVLDIQGKRAIVAIGEMRATVKMNRLDKIKKPKKDKVRAGTGTNRISKRAHVSTELHVKGFRVEQALPVVSKFIDDALMAGVKELRILHGKGTGALRQAIRDYLTAVPEVNKLTDAPLDAGGEGWTLVSLN